MEVAAQANGDNNTGAAQCETIIITVRCNDNFHDPEHDSLPATVVVQAPFA